MRKILVFTDIHIVPEGRKIIGLDPADRLSQGLEHAAAMHPDADRLIITGDLTHYGTPEEYARLKPLLDGLPWPVTLMLGNHDNRDTFRAAFPDAATDTAGFVQSVMELGDVRLITLDTLDDTVEPRHAGFLCEQRLGWLRDRLAESDTPALVFLHHHPFESGFSGMDRINLRNADALRAVLRGGPVAHVIAGHIHRTITASIDGLPITVFKSTCHQMPMMLGVDGSSHSVDEPGAYGIILSNGAETVVHFEDFTLDPAVVLTDGASG